MHNSLGAYASLARGQQNTYTTPETHFAECTMLEKDTPIFFTAKLRRRIILNGTVNEIDSEMKNVRWKTFQFCHEMKMKDAIDVPPCPNCRSCHK